MARAVRVLVVLLAVMVFWARPASAQGFGLGPRVSFVRGDLTTDTPSTDYFGGTMRMGYSRHVTFEAALDYRAQLDETGTSRIRQLPVQLSLLIYPVRSRFSPYLLGGFGIYSQFTDALNVTGQVTSTTLERQTGWHMGVGAEMFLTRHATLFLDYRYRFVQLGTPASGAQPITIPGSSLIPGLNNVSLSHQGSMWTSGMAFYF